MGTSIRSLEVQDFDAIYGAFLKAFSNYAADTSYMTRDVLYNRCIKNGVDLSCSAGVFRNGEMLGFSLTGLDNFRGQSSAFDIVTGIIPAEQGKGLSGKMFSFILQQVVGRSVSKFYLEVLQVNEPAVRAYRKAGFKINRSYECMELELQEFRQPAKVPGLEIRQCNVSELLAYRQFSDTEPSWENSFHSLERIIDPVCCYLAELGGKPAGIMAYYPATNWVMVLATDPRNRRMGIASSLLDRLVTDQRSLRERIRMINIDMENLPALAFAGKNGFRSIITQYEMVLDTGRN